MINYTMKNINVISFFISLIVFIIINFLFFSNGSKSSSAVSELPKEEITLKEKVECDDNLNDQAKKEWTIEIPQIELKAEISEGTNTETLNQYVGHFEETAKIDGNVGLAAHNRGYPVNYFAKVKYLRKGDEIYYKYNGKERIYRVEKIEVIKDTDWRYLENTDENKITLITCVEDAPMYRRCIQGIEK